MATFFFGLEVVSPLLLRFSEPMACCLYLSMKISHARRISDFFSEYPTSKRQKMINPEFSRERKEGGQKC